MVLSQFNSVPATEANCVLYIILKEQKDDQTDQSEDEFSAELAELMAPYTVKPILCCRLEPLHPCSFSLVFAYSHDPQVFICTTGGLVEERSDQPHHLRESEEAFVPTLYLPPHGHAARRHASEEHRAMLVIIHLSPSAHLHLLHLPNVRPH